MALEASAAAVEQPEPDDEDDQEVEVERQGTLSVECIGFAPPDFKWCASGGLDSTMKVWDMVSGQCRAICKHGGSVVALQWHSVLPIVVTAALDHVVRVWDGRQGVLLSELTGHNDIVTSLDVRSYPRTDETPENDIIVSVSDDGTAKVFQLHMTDLLT
jgi:WD40 repeat protein